VSDNAVMLSCVRQRNTSTSSLHLLVVQSRRLEPQPSVAPTSNEACACRDVKQNKLCRVHHSSCMGGGSTGGTCSKRSCRLYLPVNHFISESVYYLSSASALSPSAFIQTVLSLSSTTSRSTMSLRLQLALKPCYSYRPARRGSSIRPRTP